MSHSIKTINAIISGRVQGVCYRAWTVETARTLRLTGWVRNRSYGTVEAVFCGTETNVDAMIKACRSGPALARVDSIKTATAEAEGWDDFHQRRTV